MTLLIRVAQESLEITDPKNSTIPIDTTKFISEISHDQRVAFRDTVQVEETHVDSEISSR